MDKKKYAYNYLIGKGISPVIASGIVGNLVGESNLDTTIKGTADDKGSVGIAQWHSERKQGLFNYAKSTKRDWSSLDAQLDYVVHELNTTEKKTLNKLNYAKTPEEASEIFMIGYERPAKWAVEQSRGKRAKEARQLFGGEYDPSYVNQYVGKSTIPYTEQTVQKENNTPLPTMQGNVGESSIDFRFAQADEAKKQIQEYQKVEDQIAQMPTYQTQELQPEIQPQQPTYNYLSDSNLFTLNS